MIVALSATFSQVSRPLIAASCRFPPSLVRRYAQGPWVLFKANMRRQVKLFFRNRAFLFIRM